MSLCDDLLEATMFCSMELEFYYVLLNFLN